MIFLYAIRTDSVDPDDATARARIAPERLEVIDRRRGPARAQSFAASLLLEYAVKARYPDVSHPLSIALSAGGKPYFPSEPALHFSLSHSGGWAICALSDCPVGVDIEQRTPGRRDIASRCFHPDEVRYLEGLTDTAREDAFYSLWVLKESFVKATGRGLTLPLRSFCVSLDGDIPQLHNIVLDRPYTLFLLPFETDIAYRLALCTQQVRREEVIFEVLE